MGYSIPRALPGLDGTLPGPWRDWLGEAKLGERVANPSFLEAMKWGGGGGSSYVVLLRRG